MADSNIGAVARDPLAQPEDFSLVLGGPLFQLWRRAHLSDDGLSLLARRGVVISLLCWLPLFAIAAIEGQLLPGTATIPFLLDLELHVRFLVALPLLIAAERVVHERMLPTLRQFRERDLIPQSSRSLPDFKHEIGLTVVFMLTLLLGPLFVFAPQLARAKRNGRREYDAIAQRYVREFDQKWLRGGASADEAFVGTGDIQSLADLGNGLQVVRTMRVVPITRQSVIELGIATLLPFGPLLLTMLPFDQLVKMLLGVLF